MIFYFTATGNSKFIAEKISAATQERLINISDCIQNGEYTFEPAKNEAIGFVVPVYYWGLPIIVVEFLDKLKIAVRPIYSYVVLSCGSTTGDAKRFFQNTYPVDAIFGIATIDNYMAIFKNVSSAEITKRLDKARVSIDIAIEHIKNRDAGNFNSVQGIFPRLVTSIAHPFFYKNGRKTNKFSVNQDCVGCGLCEKVCPRKVIRLKDRQPEWTIPQCELCFACLHRCPAKVINYGKARSGRYLNPLTKL